MSRIFSPSYVRRVNGSQGAYGGGLEDREPPQEMFLPSSSTLYRTDGSRTGRRIGSPKGARQAGEEKISFQPKISGRESLHSAEKIHLRGHPGDRGRRDPFLERMERVTQARADGTFDAKRNAFNAASSGSQMNERGDIVPGASKDSGGNWVEWSGGQKWMPNKVPDQKPLLADYGQPPPEPQMPPPPPQKYGVGGVELPYVPGAQPLKPPPLPEVPQAWVDKSRQEKAADFAAGADRAKDMVQGALPESIQPPLRQTPGPVGSSQASGGSWGTSLFGRLAGGVDTALNSGAYHPVMARGAAIQTTMAQRRAAENAGAGSQMAKGPLYAPEVARKAVEHGKAADAAASAPFPAIGPGVPISRAGLGPPLSNAGSGGQAGATASAPALAPTSAPVSATAMGGSVGGAGSGVAAGVGTTEPATLRGGRTQPKGKAL